MESIQGNPEFLIPSSPKDVINASLSTLADEIDLDFSPPQHSHGMAIAMAHGKSPFFVKIGIYIFNASMLHFFFEIGNVMF